MGLRIVCSDLLCTQDHEYTRKIKVGSFLELKTEAQVVKQAQIVTDACHIRSDCELEILQVHVT